MPLRSSYDVMSALLYFDPELPPKEKAEEIVERLLDQYFSLPLYRHYKLVKSGSVRPSLSDSVLPRDNGVASGITENMDGVASVKPQRSFSDSDVTLVLHAGVDLDLLPSERVEIEPQPGRSGYMPDAGRFRNHTSQSDCAISVSSSTSSLYSTSSEANDFFEGYMANIMPYHQNAANDDDDDHSVITVSSTESVLSVASSEMSVLSNTDFEYDPINEELVGPHGDDEWTITSDIGVVIDVDDTQENHYMQHPPAHPPLDQDRPQPAAPHKTPSDSVLSRKRKLSEDFASDSGQPRKMARVSLSDTSISCPSICPETPQQKPRRSVRAARRRLVMDQD